MKIGIDIDDTICYTVEAMLPSICEYFNLDYEEENKKKLPYYAYLSFPDYEDYAIKYFEQVFPYVELKEDADFYINLLKKEGNQIIFITARSNNGFRDPYLLSKKYLDEHGINYDELVVGAKEKGKICKEKGIELFIDDSVSNCESVSKEGITSWLFDNSYNRDNKNLVRVKDWHEVYDKIKNQQ